MVSISAD